jgi:uncharacterized membrane protein YgdD (TMEM256/DUF423 family)
MASPGSLDRVLYLCAGIAGFLGVALGAFGAHALKTRLPPEMLAVFETGVRYQMYHVFALVAAAWAWARWPARVFSAAGALFVVGILVFSGSLYLLAFTGLRALGAVTPLGGLAFLGGWLCLAWGAGTRLRA